MNLSNTLFHTVTRKLKLNNSSLQEQKFYIKNLFSKTQDFKKITNNNNLRSQFKKNYNNVYENTTILYVITVSFLKANTFIHLSNTKGETLLFFSAGQVKLTGKQKKKQTFRN